jgi:5-formyltetrahydrofolate cyclo-ligase
MKAPPAMAAPYSPPDSTDEALVAAKAVARKLALNLRAGQDPALGGSLTEHLLRDARLPPKAIVAGFWPIQDEIDIRPLLAALHARGHPIALPVTGRRGEVLVFRAWTAGETLTPGRFGTSHPTGADCTPDVVLIPLLAFDREGHRLGYGGGFYDRTLARLPRALRIGCAFAAQEVDSVPHGPYDQRLHAVVTEAGLRYCPPTGAPAGSIGF